MSKATKIAISLPEDLLMDIERECAAKGSSRSKFFRTAVEAYLRREGERELEEQYIRGYLELPETKEEVEWVRALGMATVASEPWDEGRHE